MVCKLIGRTGPVAGRDFVLDESVAVTRIGSSPANGICLKSGGVSRDHAMLVRRDNGYWIEDSGSTNGTFVNGQRVKSERLRHLDVVTIGRNINLIFIEKAGEAEPAVPAVASAALQFVDGPTAGANLDLPPGESVLGRAPTCQVVLDHRSIGKQHAKIRRTDAQVTIEDLGSANGTFVNGQRIRTEILKNGDKITLAAVRTLRVTISADFKGVAVAAGAMTDVLPSFDQGWRTKLIWSPEELALIEANRKAIMPVTPARGGAARPPEPPRPASPAVALAARVTTSEAAEATIVARPANAAEPSAKPIRGIQILTAGSSSRQLGTGAFTVGRSADAMIRLNRNDREASRTHAVLNVKPEGVEVENRSQNGTFINAQRVDGRGAIQDGDEVRCGTMKLTIRFIR
jgi:pSer/pThr/pTyr-binding forkhead associated (FHA) protein